MQNTLMHSNKRFSNYQGIYLGPRLRGIKHKKSHSVSVIVNSLLLLNVRHPWRQV